MELIILGSAGAIPTKNRNLPAIALKYRSEIILFDCGEDLQRAFNNAGLKFNKPMKILISHFHGDHIIGLPGLLFRLGQGDRTAPLWIFGPRNLYLYLYIHKKILGLRAKYPIFVSEIDNVNNKILKYEGLDSEIPKEEINIKDNIIFESKRYILRYTEVSHSVLTYAYSFEEKERYGKFNPERARELGIPESRLWKRLHKGEVINFKGKIIDPLKEGIVGPPRKGIKITYSGDTAPCKSLEALAQNSDILIYESTYGNDHIETAREKQHSTAQDAANMALKTNSKQLILTHFSSRYKDPSILLEEAKQIFPNTILAEDLLKIKLR
ncbi:MAG: ribonuclease Z [Promethearchaeota archaeon]